MGNQVVMDRLLSRIIDHRIDLSGVDPALEQGVAFFVGGIEVGVEQDAGGVVVDQAALGMLALVVGRFRQTFIDEIVAVGDVVRGILPPLGDIRPLEARTGGRQVLVGRPGETAMIDNDVIGRIG